MTIYVFLYAVSFTIGIPEYLLSRKRFHLLLFNLKFHYFQQDKKKSNLRIFSGWHCGADYYAFIWEELAVCWVSSSKKAPRQDAIKSDRPCHYSGQGDTATHREQYHFLHFMHRCKWWGCWGSGCCGQSAIGGSQIQFLKAPIDVKYSATISHAVKRKSLYSQFATKNGSLSPLWALIDVALSEEPLVCNLLTFCSNCMYSFVLWELHCTLQYFEQVVARSIWNIK